MKCNLIGMIALLSLISLNASAEQNASKVIDDLLTGYDKRIRPNSGAGTVNVGVSMYILSLHSLSDNDMEFTIEFYFRQFWNDPRLKFQKVGDFDNFQGSSELVKTLWTPDTFFATEKESFMYTTTTTNKFIKVHSNGDISESMRISATFSCPMNFRTFPADKQICTIPLESYGYSEKGVKYYWRDGNDSVLFGSLDALSPLHTVKVGEIISERIKAKNATYSRLAFEIEFQRIFGHYMVQIYVPCLMLVIMSWLTFFLNKNAFTMRATICGITFLAMIFLLNLAQQNFPKTSYSKSLDYYTGICMTMIFFAVIEFAFICNCEHFKDSQKTPMADKIMRVVYPILFIMYTAACWYLCG